MWLHLYHLESVSLGCPTVASLRSVAVSLGSPMAASVVSLGNVLMEVVVFDAYKQAIGSSIATQY